MGKQNVFSFSPVAFMTRLVSLLALALLLSTTGCSRPATDSGTGPTGLVAGGVTATRVTDGIELYNGSETVIAYQVVNSGWLGLLAPCSDAGATCATLVQGARRVVPTGEILGASAGAFTQTRVAYWSVVQGSTQAGASELLVVM